MQRLKATTIALQVGAASFLLLLANIFILTRSSVRQTTVEASLNVGEKLEELHQSNCTDVLCTEYLTNDLGLKEFKQCKKNLHRFDVAFADNETGASGSCRFMDPTNRGPVGLISSPGSGNTWVRQLLQQATGICTGTYVQQTALSCKPIILYVRIPSCESMHASCHVMMCHRKLETGEKTRSVIHTQTAYRSVCVPTYRCCVLRLFAKSCWV